MATEYRPHLRRLSRVGRPSLDVWRWLNGAATALAAALTPRGG